MRFVLGPTPCWCLSVRRWKKPSVMLNWLELHLLKRWYGFVVKVSTDLVTTSRWTAGVQPSCTLHSESRGVTGVKFPHKESKHHNRYLCSYIVYLGLLSSRTTHLAVPAPSAPPEVIRERVSGSLEDQSDLRATDQLIKIVIAPSGYLALCARWLVTWTDHVGPGEGLLHLWTVVVE